MMDRRTLTCKQCGRELPETHFKVYASRSTGVRSSSTGRYTVCKTCEKMDAYATKLHKRVESGVATEGDLKERDALVGHYQRLMDAGLPLVTAGARRLMGVQDPPKRRGAPSKLFDLLDTYNKPVDVDMYNDNVRTYADCAEQKRRVYEEGQWGAETTAPNVSSTCDSEAPPLAPAVDQEITQCVNMLQELLTMELTNVPGYYDDACDHAINTLRELHGGTLPKQYESLASQVLDRLDEYAENN